MLITDLGMALRDSAGEELHLEMAQRGSDFDGQARLMIGKAPCLLNGDTAPGKSWAIFYLNQANRRALLRYLLDLEFALTEAR